MGWGRQGGRRMQMHKQTAVSIGRVAESTKLAQGEGQELATQRFLRNVLNGIQSM